MPCLAVSGSSSPLSDHAGEPTRKSSPKFLWNRGLTDLIKEEPLMVLSFTLNIEGLDPRAGEEVLERGREMAGDAGACGLLGLWRESSVDSSTEELLFLVEGGGERSCLSLPFLSDSEAMV